MKSHKNSIIFFSGMLIIMYLSKGFFLQIDFTNDKRYSLSNNTIKQLESLKSPLKIDVYLTGNLPTAYLHLRNELDALLNQLEFYNKNIIIQYKEPFKFGKAKDVIIEMQKYGMPPEVIFENKDGNRQETIVFPWLILNYDNRSEKIALIQKQLGDTENEKIIRSLQNLEYIIIDGIYKLRLLNKKNLAVLNSHQSSENIKIKDLLQNLSSYYNLASFDLKKNKHRPEKSLDNLSKFEVLMISNPKESFSQTEKYILDQYSLRGGKILWLINGIIMDRDSLFNDTGKAYGLGQELNLDDYFFHKGLRIKKTLIQDIYCAPIVLAKGNENDTQYIPFPWTFYPVSEPENFMIGNKIGPVLIRFASPIDTLTNQLSKKLLIQSSNFTKTTQVPIIIELEQATKKVKPSDFKESAKSIAYLVKGKHNSLFLNRVKPFKTRKHLENGQIEIILFGDGNIAENQVEKGEALALGYDKWTNNFYANKLLMMNAIHYLMGNKDRLALRQKSWKTPILDKIKIEKSAKYWKWFTLISPLVLSFSIGIGTQLLRIRNLKN